MGRQWDVFLAAINLFTTLSFLEDYSLLVFVSKSTIPLSKKGVEFPLSRSEKASLLDFMEPLLLAFISSETTCLSLIYDSSKFINFCFLLTSGSTPGTALNSQDLAASSPSFSAAESNSASCSFFVLI